MNYEFELLVQRVAELESEVRFLRNKISELEARLVGVYQGNTYVFPPPIQLIADTPETHVKLPPQS